MLQLIISIFAVCFLWHRLGGAAAVHDEDADLAIQPSTDTSPSQETLSDSNNEQAESQRPADDIAATYDSSDKPLTTTFTTEITTGLLYGILATTESWLIGVRKLSRRQHANFLALKIAGHRLPRELVDLVADELYDVDLAIIQRKVDAYEDSFHWNTQDARISTPNEREVQRQIDESGVIVNLLERHANTRLSLDPKVGGMVIVRASKVHPHMAIVPTVRKLPSSVIPGSDGLREQREAFDSSDDQEKVYSICSPALQAHWLNSKDRALYNAPRDDTERRWGMCRSLHGGRFDEVVATWDDNAARQMVERIGLEVVKPSDFCRDPMKPSLVVHQGFGTDHSWDSWFKEIRWDS